MRPILLIVAVLAFGAIISRADPGFVDCGTTQIPVVPVGYIVHLTLNVAGEITDLEIRLVADLDADGDVDLDDYAIFAAAFTGPK